MRRWNGWGDDTFSMSTPESGMAYLHSKLTPGPVLADASLESVCAQVPPSRLEDIPHVVTQPEDRIRHARGQSLPDWLAMRSGDFEVFPDGVAYPQSTQQVADILSYACQHSVDVIPYGGGTSVAGHINPLKSPNPVLTVDMGRMNQLLDLNVESQIATFGAGTPGPEVESQLRAKGYTLGHFPQSWELSTIGGWVASRSSGQQSLRYGRIEQMFAGCTMITPKGEWIVPTIPASSAGPDLREVIMGSEGRMGIITEVQVRVTPLAEEECFFAVFLPSFEHARKAMRDVVQNKIPLSMLRVSNALETETQLKLAGHENLIKWLERYLSLRGVDDGKCMLTFGVTGNKKQNRLSLKQANSVFKRYGGVKGPAMMGKKWAENRFKFPYLRENLWLAGYCVDTFETATDWHRVTQQMHAMEDAVKKAGLEMGFTPHVYTHLSHTYTQGCSIYTTYVFPNGKSYSETLQRWQAIKQAASESVANGHATISHQHGVGKDHAPFLLAEKGRIGMEVLHTLVDYFDEKKQLNPGTLLEKESE
ncbi:FAD-binding oxidoreductase [Bermanella sp. R86510]|uniref:FAD-binding oxidoreductase n=1 Tax=unclassified Bermanella TaxID=2627862 RepID=UPI0037C8BA71